MTAERWERVKELFAEAQERDPGERSAFLLSACGEDAALRKEVESLLAAYDQAPTFLEAPAAENFSDPGEADREDPARAFVGRTVGAWRLERLLASGGMGAVFLASRADHAFEKQVAVKFLRGGFDSGEVRQRFLTERQTLASLNHPNIASLLDGGTTPDGQPFLVMEFVEGLPLDRYCDEHRLGTRPRLEIFRSVCSAVQYAHQKLIIHRDLKPANILVTPDGIPKLLDFGIAKILDPEFAGPVAGATLGPLSWMTPEYASPEQVRGEAVSTATDVYSLGVILYQLLTGHRPYRFKNRSRTEIERVVANETPLRPSTVVVRSQEETTRDGTVRATRTPESISRARGQQPFQLRAHLSGDLDAIVLQALRKEPERRYASVRDFSEDLRRYLEGLPVTARPDTMAYRSSRFIRRHKLGVGAATLVFLSLIGGILATARQARIAADEAARARQEAQTARRTVEFMLKGYEVADPFENPGETVTARELLEQQAAQIDKDEELAKEPEVRARLMEGIGRAFLGLHLDKRGVALLAKARDLMEEAPGENELSLADTLHWLGIGLRRMGDHPGSLAAHEQALAIRTRLLGPDALDTLASRNARALTLYQSGHLEEAQKEYQALLDRETTLLDDMPSEDKRVSQVHEKIAMTLNNLGGIAFASGDTVEAEDAIRKALAIQKSVYGPEHPKVATNLNNLGMIQQAAGDLDGAEKSHREALEMRRKLLGPDHPHVAGSLNNLAGVLYDKGETEEAGRLYEQALEIVRLRLGEDHPTVLQLETNLATVLENEDRFDRAETLLRSVLEKQRRRLSPGDPALAELLDLLGELLLDEREDPRNAEPLLRESLGIYREADPPDDWSVARMEVLLGSSLARLHRFEEAERLLLSGHQTLKSLEPESEESVTVSARRLAKLYDAWGRPRDAERYRKSEE
ncbi:MAG: tetratricopeptide repeat protein [Planctomycetota bacterium]